MLALGLSTVALVAQAQEPGGPPPGSPAPRTFDCYGPGAHRSAPTASRPPFPSSSRSSTYGSAFTPQGDLKVLVIFVGFNEDINNSPQCGDYANGNWPQLPPNPSPNTPVGLTFPSNFSSTCYTANSQFSAAATDQSLSNFFYQMSGTSPHPLRMTFGTLPGRVNINGNSRGDYLNVYIPDALAAAAAAYPNFNWGDYDNRTNHPNYNYDSRVSAPDGKLDYVVFCFRTGCASNVKEKVGMAGPFGSTIPGTSYQVLDAHCQSGLDLDKSTFLHEMAHTLYDSPHEFGANGTVGTHFYQSFGWGMMQNIGTSFSANAWERWYLGWTELRTGPAQVSSDLQVPVSGQYVLRDYTTTGDVIRVKIPNTSQYLWLENRAGQGPCDRRSSWDYGGDGRAFLPAPTGLLAMVEEMGDRSTFLSYTDKDKTNGLRPVSAQGSFDYYTDGVLTPWYNHVWGPIETFTGPPGNRRVPAPNATGGHSEIMGIRLDSDHNGIIEYDDYHGNGDKVRDNDGSMIVVVYDGITDGMLGPHIGTQQVGFRYGLDTNPMIIPHQRYDAQQQRLSTIPLNGLSIQITAVDPATGAITLQIESNNTRIGQDTRWTGSLQTYPVANATKGYEIFVDGGGKLTLDRSGTPMRSTLSLSGDFENDTELRVSTGTNMAVNNGGLLRLTGGGTTLYMEDKTALNLDGGKVELTDGTTISVQYFSDISDLGAVAMLGGRIVERSTGSVQQRGPAPVAYPQPRSGQRGAGLAGAGPR